MTKIIQLHIWMQNKRMKWKEPEVINPHSKKPQPGKRIVLDVSEGTGIPEMKVAVAQELEKYKKNILYYYVVAVVERDDGEIGYRTIVGKVFMKKDKKR
jgi:hypothetical protein